LAQHLPTTLATLDALPTGIDHDRKLRNFTQRKTI
jgi:hypothetical protein